MGAFAVYYSIYNPAWARYGTVKNSLEPAMGGRLVQETLASLAVLTCRLQTAGMRRESRLRPEIKLRGHGWDKSRLRT